MNQRTKSVGSSTRSSSQGLSALSGLSSGLVYSSEAGRMCPDCRQPVAACVCRQAKQPLPVGPIRVARETKGRGGKAVTLVRSMPLDAQALLDVAKQLRAACGSGGTVKDGVIEVQGDHVDKVIVFLAKLGYVAKKTGGA